MIFLRINCQNVARHVASAVRTFEVVIAVSRQIEYDWLSILRYDMTRCTIFMCVQKLANNQLNLPHGAKPNKERVKKKLKTKNR